MPTHLLEKEHLQRLEAILEQIRKIEEISNIRVESFFFKPDLLENDVIKINRSRPKDPKDFTYIERVGGEDLFISTKNTKHMNQAEFEALNLDFSEASVIDSMLNEGIITRKRYHQIVKHLGKSDDMFKKPDRLFEQQKGKLTFDDKLSEFAKSFKSSLKIKEKEDSGISNIKMTEKRITIDLNPNKLANYRILETNQDLVILTIIFILIAIGLYYKISPFYLLIATIFILYIKLTIRISKNFDNRKKLKKDIDRKVIKKVITG